MTALVSGPGASVKDAAGNVYAITPGAQITINGNIVAASKGVVTLAYDSPSHVIWQKTNTGDWYSQTSPSASWGGPFRTSPFVYSYSYPYPGASANDTLVLAGSSDAIMDSYGSRWTITPGGQIAVNGVVDAPTARVIKLAYVNGEVWQENADKLWWGKTGDPSAADGWSPNGGTAQSPLPPAQTAVRDWRGAVDNNGYNPANWSPTGLAPGDTLKMSNGTISINSGSLEGNPLVLESGSQTVDLVNGANVTVVADHQTSVKLAVSVQTAGSIAAPPSYNEDTLTLITPADADFDGTISLGTRGVLHLNDSMTFGKLTVNGGIAQLHIDSPMHLNGANVLLNAYVYGATSIEVGWNSDTASRLELAFGGESGMTINVVGGRGSGASGLILDQPAAFVGSVNLQSGFVELVAAAAASYDIKDDVLALFDANGKTVDSLRFATPAGTALSVEQSSRGVFVSTNGGPTGAGYRADAFQPGGPGAVLPLHHA